MKKCSRCTLTKPLTDFGPNARSADGYAYVCKACRASAQRQHYAKNREYYQEYARNRSVENGQYKALKAREWKEHHSEHQ